MSTKYNSSVSSNTLDEPPPLTLKDLARHNRVSKNTKSCDDSTDAMNGSEEFNDDNGSDVDDVVTKDRLSLLSNDVDDVVTNDRFSQLTASDRHFSSTMGIAGDDEDNEDTSNHTSLAANNTDDDSVTFSSYRGMYVKLNISDDDEDVPFTTRRNKREDMRTSQVDSTRVFADNDSDYQL